MRPGAWPPSRQIVTGLLVLLVLLAAGAVVDLIRIRAAIDHGQTALSDLALDTLDEGLVPTIDRAASQLSHADSIADRSPFLAVAGVIPPIRSQVAGLRDLTQVTEQLGNTARSAAREIDVDLERAGSEPSARVDLMDTVLHALDDIETAVASLDVGARGDLIGPLADARAQVVAELDRVPARLDEARGYVRGLRRLLAGPSHYLLLGANNAEMRGGAGMPLSAGVVTIDDGDIEFGEFKQLAYLDLGQPDVHVPSAWRETYRRWSVGRSYPETAVSPNFAFTGPIFRGMAPNAGFGEVDGVLEVDAIALRELLAVIGPVDLDGVTYDASNVAQKVLNESYLTFRTLDDRSDRVEVQSQLAEKIFDEFKEREVPIAQLALALQEAARGRHLLAHSADPDVQALWDSIGADGSLPPEGLMVTAQNVAANKQDWYLDPLVTLNVLPAIDGSWRARLTVTIANPVPEKTSPYIDGNYDGLTNGTHRTMIAVYLPQFAYGIHSLDGPFSEGGDDPPLRMFAKRIEIPRGETRRVALEFRMPADKVAALIMPSGRARPVTYNVNGYETTDATTAVAYWGQAPKDPKTPGAALIAALLALAGALAVTVGGLEQLRAATVDSPREVAEPLRRAPALGGLLFVAALAVLVAGELISRHS